MAYGHDREALFADRRTTEPPRPRRSRLAIGAAALAVLAAALLAWWSFVGDPAVTPTSTPQPPVAQVAQAPLPVEPVLPPAPTLQVPPDASLPPLERADEHVAARLTELLGRSAVKSRLVTDGFVGRFVATVDNLGRQHASPSMWPVPRTSGRFTVETVDGRTVIAASNAQRYTPLVALIERVDVERAVDTYSRLYPLFQRAYEDLGFPTAYFNARLVEVIDHLLQAPEPARPVEVRLLELQGPGRYAQPWVHYEFADPALESLSAGQKLLVRVGPENARRLKARLAQLRGALTGSSGATR